MSDSPEGISLALVLPIAGSILIAAAGWLFTYLQESKKDVTVGETGAGESTVTSSIWSFICPIAGRRGSMAGVCPNKLAEARTERLFFRRIRDN